MDFNTQRFCIIDIETTGGISKRDKITEIAIIVYHQGEILETFESLVNPERSIPHEITRITGITDKMVENAPKFFEIAKDVLKMMEGYIFVAHNVFFDYNFIKEEFHQLGYTFSSKKLCTVQLSRRYFKGLKSYSLGSLIEHFNISVTQRHRAMEDTKATLNVFARIIEQFNNQESNFPSLSEILKENKIPPNLKLENLNALPEKPGIYYMRNKVGIPMYIGKSKNIRDRIFQHFNDSSLKTKRMLDSLYYLDSIETGNELMASLIEAKEIKIHQPEINKALRKKTHLYLLTALKQTAGHFKFRSKETEWLDSHDEVINHYSNRASLIEHIDFLIYKFNLCKKVNDDLIDGNSCYSYQIGQCHGACINLESSGSYNARFILAYNGRNRVFKESFYIIGEGRHIDERSVVIVENGFCSYLGFLSFDQIKNSLSEMKESLEPYIGNVETNRMIELFLQKKPEYKKYNL